MIARLDELPEDRREALIMRFALGMSNREIARALGRTDGATKVLIHRAIKQLEELIAMTEAAGELRLEHLLADALRPIEPPEDLASRAQATLGTIAEHAAAELSSWADELSEKLEALRDPRNWVRPVAAVAVGGAAAGALLVAGARRRRRPYGLRDTAERLLREIR